MTRVASVVVGFLLVVAVMGCETPPRYHDIEVDLSPLRILPIAPGTQPAAVTPEQAIDRVQGEVGPLRVVRLGRRWTPGPTTVWVVVVRPANAAAGADWLGYTVNDQTGAIIASFDAASLRAFGVPLPDW